VALRHTAVGMHEQSNSDTIQRFQTKVLRNIVDAPRYIRNSDFHTDLQMETVRNEIGKFVKKHEGRLLHHVNVGAIQLLDNSEIVRRIKRRRRRKINPLTWCSDH